MMNMKGYKTSKNYKRLKELLDKGYKVVCIGPTNFPDEYYIGLAEKTEDESYHFGGDWAMEMFWDEKFVENCADENMEFIDITEE